MDLNMVRAGVVQHPSEYGLSGYNEIQNPPKRYAIINRKRLLELFSSTSEDRFQQVHRNWVEAELIKDAGNRNGLWSESVAIGLVRKRTIYTSQ